MNIQSSIDEFENNNFDSFENLSKCSPIDKDFFLEWLSFILDDISKRFQDFQTVMFILFFTSFQVISLKEKSSNIV